MYNSQAKRVRQKGEVFSEETLVETAGFIPKERKIRMMLQAGKRLDEMRKAGMFDFDPGQKIDLNISVDPTRSKGFDLAEASMMLSQLKIKADKIKNQISQTKKDIEDEKLKEKKPADAGDEKKDDKENKL